MMNGCRESDSFIVSEKPSNKVRDNKRMAEKVEKRRLAKGNLVGRNKGRTLGRETLQRELDPIRQKAVSDKHEQFTSIWHHVYSTERLKEAYRCLKRRSAPGVDGQTWEEYGRNLESNLAQLAGRLRCGAYRAMPVRRAYIPKLDGRQRPIGVPVLEDKIVQRATVEVLNAIYEVDFLGFTHICSTTRAGTFIVRRKTEAGKMRAKLKEIKQTLRKRMHWPVPKVGAWLKSVLLGHYRYYGVPNNWAMLSGFKWSVLKLWYKTLLRRSQKRRMNWKRMYRVSKPWLPSPRIFHDYPSRRLRVTT